MGGRVEDIKSLGQAGTFRGGSDKDREQEEEPTGHGMRLPRNLLAGEATVSHRRQNQAGARARPQLGEEEDTQEEETKVGESQEEEKGELEW